MVWNRTARYFNPRCPSGQRPIKHTATALIMLFQSTLPKWAATIIVIYHLFVDKNFNPRCPSGQRQLTGYTVQATRYFNPRCPSGQRLPGYKIACAGVLISIHAAQVGSDSAFFSKTLFCPHFNPRCPSGQRLRNIS